jgi:hypothetical protein
LHWIKRGDKEFVQNQMLEIGVIKMLLCKKMRFAYELNSMARQ